MIFGRERRTPSYAAWPRHVDNCAPVGPPVLDALSIAQ
jgi:hypothetical protein